MSLNHKVRLLLAVMVLLIQLPCAISAFGQPDPSAFNSMVNPSLGNTTLPQAAALTVGEATPAGFGPGSLITLPILATGFTGVNRIEAVTLFVTYDPEVLEFAGSVVKFLAGAAVFPQPGLFALAWSSVNSVEIEADTLLFLQFEYLGGRTLISFREDSELANHEEEIDVIFTGNELGTLIESYTLYYAAGEGGLLEGETTQVVQEGGDGSAILAVFNDGYHFVQWSDGRTDNPRTDLAVTSGISVTALFARIQYELTVAAEPNGYGTALILSSPPFFHGMVIHISATPVYGYQFLYWTDDGEQVSDAAEYSFTILHNLSLTAYFKPRVFSVTAAAVPGEGGTVAGDGQYDYNTLAALEVTPAEGYVFSGWYEDGISAGSEPELAVVVLMDRHFEARFTHKVYTLSYLPGPGGQILGEALQYVVQGQDGSALLAVPDEGYLFTGWSDGRTDNPRSDQDVKSDLTVTAIFGLNQYALTVTAEPPMAGTAHILSEGPFYHGTEVVVQATPSSGYSFSHWLEGETTVSEDADYQFAILNNRSLTAVFVPLFFSVGAVAVPVDGGAVAGAGNYVYQAVALLTATAALGYDFAGWFDGEALVGSAPELLFTVLADRFFEARFELRSYSLNYLAGFGGRIEGLASQTVAHGQDGSQVLAVADDGYYFAGWSDGVEENPRTDREVTAGLSVTAIFGQPGRYTVSLNASPAGAGTLTGAGSYIEGDVAMVNAVAADGYRFENWSRGATVRSLLPEYSFEVWSNMALTANFTPITYTLAYSAGDGGSIEGEAVQVVAHGMDSSAVMAVPAEGFHFAGWSDGQIFNPRTDLNVVSDISVEAVFAISEYSLTVIVMPEEGGTAVGAGTYTHNSLVRLEASPNEGFAFSGWYNGIIFLGGETELYVTLTSAMVVTALFTPLEYEVTAMAIPTEGGTVKGAGTYTHNSLIRLEASPNEGFAFSGWFENDLLVGEETELHIQVTSNRMLEAHFSFKTYTLTYLAGDGGWLEGAAVQEVTYGLDGSAVLAVPAEGFHFAGWSDGRGDNPRTDTAVMADLTVTATFTINSYELILGVEPEAGGQVQIGTAGPYVHGMEVQVRAIPSHGYDFYCWKEDGEVLSESPEYGFVLTSSRFLVAEFVQRTYSVVFTVVSSRGGVVDDAVITFDGIIYPPGHYQFEKLQPGVYAYRISKEGYFELQGQVVVDGQDVLVEVALTIDDVGIDSADIPGSLKSLKVYPNPARQWLQLSGSAQIIEVKMFDLLGNLVIHATNAVPVKEMGIDLDGLIKGTYILVVAHGQRMETRKVLVAE